MTLVARRQDKVIVDEVKSTYRDVPVTDRDVVLDLGANIGASARLFLDKGAGRVIAVEPDPSNVILAQRNLKGTKAVLIWAAVGDVQGRTKFHIRPRKPYLGSTIPDTDRKTITVPVVTLVGLLKQYRPTIIKCDIEFGEYQLPGLFNLPDYVRVLAIELHVRYDLVFTNLRQTDEQLRKQRRLAAALMASFTAQGFTEIRRKEKQAKGGAIEDDTGLKPLTKSIDAIWAR